MARTRLTNQQPLVDLIYNPYQVAFLNARRLRVCPHLCSTETGTRLMFSSLEGTACPSCGGKGLRPYRQFLLRAGRRGGKTRIGALSAIEEAALPETIGWCCAPSFPELEDYVLPAFFSQLPAAWFDHPLTEWSENRLELRLPNRSLVQFRSLDDTSRGAGPSLDWLWMDEARKIQELAWQLIRPALVDRKGIAFLTTSPDWGEDWVHKQFWVPAEEGRPGTWATSYRTIDNPVIDPAEVERSRATMPPELFRREYEASIEFPTGTIYGDLIDQCDADDARVEAWIPEWPALDPSRTCIFGLDPGTDHPFAGVLIIVTARGLVFAGEYLERNKPFIQHAIGLKAVKGLLSPRWAIDKSAAQATIELAQYGIYCQLAANAVDAGIQRLYAWGSTGKLLISRTKCPQLLKQLRSYRYADYQETKAGLPKDARVYKKDDDLADAARYGVMLWPELPDGSDVDAVARGKRDLSLLCDRARGEVERNLTAEASEDGLIRVTDDFTPEMDRPSRTDDAALHDFYV